MGYEARQEAMNDAIAERAREMMPDEDSYTLDVDIPENIADGIYDEAVLDRAIQMVKNLGVGSLNIVHALKEMKK